MSKKKYWQSFGELHQTEEFQQSTKNEFKEELLPLADLDDKGILDAKTPRRDFLKYLGFSTAAAAIAASCEMPVRKVVPYLQRPDNVIPGVANYYASTYVNGGDVISVVVKQRDGRPIKIEGNELSSKRRHQRTITGICARPVRQYPPALSTTKSQRRIQRSSNL